MPKLRDLQAGFAEVVLAGRFDALAPYLPADAIPPEDRLAIYRNTARAVMTEALRLTFPAVERLVGRDFFAMAAARFVRQAPPDTADLAEYGVALPDFLAHLPEAAPIPYLADVARFEWALHQAATAEDAPSLDADALGAVAAEDQPMITFIPHPSVRLLELATPADAVADAVLAGDDRAMAAIDLAAGPRRLVLHRGATGVCAEQCDADAFAFARALFAGATLAGLVDAAPAAAGTLLAGHLASGRIAGYALQTQTGEP